MTEPSSTFSLVLVGVDGSAGSERALRWCARLATSLDAEVLAVHALGLLDRLDPESDPVPAFSHRDEIEQTFRSTWCQPLVDAAVRHRCRVVDGPPSMVLLRVAEEEPVDLIVVGSRGVGGFPELLLGSTSLQVAQHSPVPVTIVPAG